MQRLLVIAGVALSALIAPLCHALGFGEIQLRSALNQPLKAEIPLLAVKPAERDQISVDIASVETFKRFGIERPGVLDQIDIEVVPGASETRLRILLNSRVPIQEPFLTFLLEANWPDGRAIREYTVLLDPPISEPAVSANTTPPPAQFDGEPPAPTQVQTAPAQPAPAFEPAPEAEQFTAAPEPVPAPRAPENSAAPGQQTGAAPARRYGPVAANETLWSVANQTRPPGNITQDQMMLAIYLANLEDFDDNINRMHKGAVLAIPSTAEIRRIDKRVATAEVKDQARIYAKSRGPSRQPATAQPAGNSQAQAQAPKLKLEPATEVEPRGPENSAGAIAADSGAPQANEAQNAQNIDRPLEAAPAKADSDAVQNEPIAPAQLLASDASQAPSQEIDQATGNVSGVSHGEQTNPAAATQPPDDTAATASAQPGQSVEPSQSAQADGLDELLAQGATSQHPATPEDAKPAAIASRGANDNSPEKAQSGAGSSAFSGVGVNAGAARTAAGGESVVPESAYGLITPQRILLLLGGVLLIIAVLMLWNRRQYKPVPADFSFNSDDGNDAIGPAQGALAATAAATTTADQAEIDDLLADADSHIAYELYDEALAALHLGLEANPGHPALQRKLLEVHHAAGDANAFMQDLEKYFPDGARANPGWSAIAAMARDFAPDDPRFQVADDMPADGHQAAEEDGLDQPSPWATEDAVYTDELEAAATHVTDADSDPTDAGAGWDNWQNASPTATPDTAAELSAAPDTGDTDSLAAAHPVWAGSDSGDEKSELDAPDHTQQADTSGLDEGSWPPPSEDRAAARDDADQPTVAQGRDDQDDQLESSALDDRAAPDMDTDTDMGLDFDLADFDAPSDAAPDEPSQYAADAEPKRDGPDALDFDIHELELGDDSDLHQSAALLEDQDSDSAEQTPPEMPPVPGSGASGVQAPDLEWSEGQSLNDEQDLPETPAASHAGQPGTGIGAGEDPLDEMLRIEDFQDDAQTQASTAPETDHDADVDEDEIITKLDLARAYIDMGEPEMAASLLEDVRTQGSAEQQREAQSLLERTG